MGNNLDQIELVKNEKKRRFELEVNGFLGFINYGDFGGGNYALVHTEIDPALEGKGVGKILVLKTLNYIKNEGKKILPYCPFVFAYIKRYPEWKHLVDEHFEGYSQL